MGTSTASPDIVVPRRRPIMNPRRFFMVAGIFLITIGGLGVAGLLGRISDAGFFRPPGWINFVHLSVGVASLLLAMSGFVRLRQGVLLVGATLLNTIGILGLGIYLFVRIRGGSGSGLGTEFADPSDHLVHLSVGALAFWAWRNR